MTETTVYQIFERIGQTDEWIGVRIEESEEAAQQAMIDMRGLTTKQYRCLPLSIVPTPEDT